jgi:predicted acylesterase/phospholipase RssA
MSEDMMDDMTRRDALRLTTGIATLGVIGSTATTPEAAAEAARPQKVGPQVFDLAFRGGGVKGIAFIGALDVLFKCEPQPRIRRMIGSSAGAIFATCLAAGYKPAEMLEQMMRSGKADDAGEKASAFARFLDDPAPKKESEKGDNTFKRIWAEIKSVRDPLIVINEKKQADLVSRIVRCFSFTELLGPMVVPFVNRFLKKTKIDDKQAASMLGKCDGLLQIGAACHDKPFRDWMADVLDRKGISKEMTLKEFHEKFSRGKGQQLSLVATDVTAQESLVLNHLTAPELPIFEAVRMSMGIPFVWPEVTWDKKWGKYSPRKGVNTSRNCHKIVDGGVLSNFPLRYLMDEKGNPDPEGVLGTPDLPEGIKEEAAVRKVGLTLNNALPEKASDSKLSPWYTELPLYQTASRVLDTMMDSHDQELLRRLLDKDLEKVLCKIDTTGFSMLEFDITEKRVLKLVERGREGMTRFLKGK